MVYRLSAIAVFLLAASVLFWNAWLREDTYGDAVVGAAWMMVYATAAMFLTSLFVIFFPGYRPQDRYWGYATLGLVLGFWLQR
jgi:hypothetical protein